MIDLSRPADGPELLDDPSLPWEELSRAYADIELSNVLLGGLGPIVRECGDLIRVAARDGAHPVTILDAGCGGGDASRALAQWAREESIAVRVLAVDLSPAACRRARETCAEEPDVEVHEGDAFAAGFRADVVHAGMMLHHVPRPEQASALRALRAAAGAGLVVSDLRRTAFGYHGVRLFGAVTRRGRLFRHDGPLSVRRGFTLQEARELADRAGLREARVTRQPFSRLTWTAGPFDRGSSS